jgi:hypothetical protein
MGCLQIWWCKSKENDRHRDVAARQRWRMQEEENGSNEENIDGGDEA